MKTRKMLAFVLALVLVAATLLSGCNKTQQPGTDKNKLDADQTFKIVGYDFKSLDTAAESDAESFTTFAQVFEGLYIETPQGNKPALAEKTDVSSDGLTYTFTIRDAKWSDGKPVTANDFVFAWDRLIDPANAFDYEHFIDMVKGVPEFIAGTGKLEDVGIKATDAKHLVVTLSAPCPYFTALLSFEGLAPQRQDVFEKLGANYGSDWQNIVYNGPFTISNYAKGSEIDFTKNANYWNAASVKLQTAKCPIITEPATLIQMFQSKDLDETGATGDYIAQLDAGAQAGGYTHMVGTNGGTYYIIFNMKNKVLANAKVRQAMVAAFDKKAFLDTVFKRHIPSYGMVAPGISIGDKIYRTLDDAKAGKGPQKDMMATVSDPKALFMQGLSELGITDPSTVTLTMLNGPQSSLQSALAQFIQSQFQDKLGIKVNLVFSVDSPTYFKDRTDGKFDLCTGGWGPDYNDVSTYYGLWKTGDGNNNGKWSNAQYDQLVNDGQSQMDPAKRLQDYQQAEKILTADDPAIINTYYSDINAFMYNYVHGLFICTFSGYYILRDVYIQGRQ